jgi:RNA recognition motif-containing protein
MNIHVANLSLNIGDSDIRRLFSVYGEVNSAVIVRDKLNGRSQGSALIDMDNNLHAQQAILCLDKTVVDGKSISVTEIKYSIRDYKN